MHEKVCFRIKKISTPTTKTFSGTQNGNDVSKTFYILLQICCVYNDATKKYYFSS